MKKLVIFILLLTFVTLSYGQVMRCEPKDGYFSGVTHSTDSTTFYQRYYFDVSEQMETDTLQMILWLYSSDGAAHVTLRYFYAMRIAGLYNEVGEIDKRKAKNKTRLGTKADTFYKLSPDSTTLSTDFSTEGMTAHMIVGAAKDTLENATNGMKIWPDAVCVAIGGTTNNRADLHYATKVVGRKGEQ